MLRGAKRYVLGGARLLGLTSLTMRTRWRRNRLTILAWHGTSIDDEHEWNPRLYIPPSLFRRRLELIAEAKCNVLPLDTAVRLLYRGELPPRAVALTVDDGAFDFYKVAFPIFQSFGFPVTVYLTSYYANLNWPVYDVMAAYLLWKGRGRTLNWPEIPGCDALELRGSTIQKAADRFRRYGAEEGLTSTEKDALLHRLAERLDLDYAPILQKRILHLMNLGEARELAASGVDFQLHTHRHRVPFDKGLFQREIADNRAWLQRIGVREANHLCYPSGVYCEEFLPWLRELGILSATTCEPGLASRGAETLLLPRLVDSVSVSEDAFVAWLSGLASWIPSRRSKGREEGQLLKARSEQRKVAAAGHA